MTKSQKKKKIVWQQWIGIIFFLLIGAVCGFLMMNYLDSAEVANRSPIEKIGSLIMLFVIMYLAIFIQMIIHEAGHLVFGLASGYKFSSFRIMNFMWIKENGKIKLRRFSLAGTGGQCLMVPPDMVDDKIPVVLYNLGGSIMNMITALIFLWLYFVTISTSFLSTIMLMISVIGFIIAIMNGVPMRMGMVNNDGYNVFALTRNRDALRSFWLQMKMNEQITKGIRLKDMPDDWFFIPSDDEMANSMVAVMGVFACNRLMDIQNFEEANKTMSHLLEIESGIVDIHRNLMICDRIYCELINGNVAEVVELYTKELKKFMKLMKKFPSVLRTEYTYALLNGGDVLKAEAIKAEFERCLKNYPHPNEVAAERELMCIAYDNYNNLH